MVATSAPTKIDSIATANRYLAELTPSLGAADAVQLVRKKCTAAVSRELDELQSYIEGNTTTVSANNFTLYGVFLKHLPDQSHAGAGISVINRSLNDAHRFAHSVRAGLPGDLYYSAALLLVLCVISFIWLFDIAPAFSSLFSSFGGELPAYSRTLLDAPWLLFLPLVGLMLTLVGLIVGTRRVASAIDTMTPLAPAWLNLLSGLRVARSHERWRVATLASAWTAAGIEPVDALNDAVEKINAAGQSVTELSDTVQLANELGLARHELDYQCQKSMGDYQVAIESRRALASRVMQLLVAVLVGVVAIAIYLPIFSMGSVI